MEEICSELSEINSLILKIKNNITSRRFFELGDDPNILAKIRAQFDQVDKIIKGLASCYTPKHLQEGNPYYRIVKNIHETLDFLNKVRKGGKGSKENTEQILEYIQNFEEILDILAHDASIVLFPYETHLVNLKKYLKNLHVEHPAHKRFDYLSQKLRSLYLSGEITDGKHPIFYELDQFSSGLWGPKFSELLSHTLEDDDEIFTRPLDEPSPADKYWAILVGVEQHDSADIYGQLPNASYDVTHLAETLLSSDCYDLDRMSLFCNRRPTSADLSKAYKGEPKYIAFFQLLKSLEKQIGQNDLLLLYFSGHGIVHNNSAYLVFQDTKDALIEVTAFEMQKLYNEVNKLSTKVKIIILDTCYAGAILTTKSADKMSKEFDEKVFSLAEGIFVMTSCKADEKSFPYDIQSDEPMSVFTHFFIQGLKNNGRHEGFVTLNDLNIYTSNAVQQWSINSVVSLKPHRSTSRDSETPF